MPEFEVAEKTFLVVLAWPGGRKELKARIPANSRRGRKLAAICHGAARELAGTAPGTIQPSGSIPGPSRAIPEGGENSPVGGQGG
jgi:hypothetical protein